MRQVILNFHGIGTPRRPLEPGEAPYWVEEDFFHETLAVMDRLKDRVAVTLTFDDGNASDLTIAAPALAQQGHRGRFFPLAGRVDTPGSLSAEDLRALVAAGHHIGNHGHDHVNWTGLDSAGQAREWQEARSVLAQAAGQEITEAAIPFGAYNATVLGGLRTAGYARIYSSDGGTWRNSDWPVPRTSPRSDMTIADIEAVLLGREPLTARLRRRVARSIKARR